MIFVCHCNCSSCRNS